MIVAINTRTEYGKQSDLGINIMPELGHDENTCYAYSMDQAKAWLKEHKAFADVEIHDYRDGRFALWSEWRKRDDILELVFDYGEATHQRQIVTLYPVNTIYENAGYKPMAVSA